MSTVLVTGGAGFIGSHICESLVKKSHTVFAMDDLSGGNENNVPKEAMFILMDICDKHKLNEFFERYQIDYIIHAAAYAAEGLSHFIRNYNYNNNLIGSTNLINCAVNSDVKCFVFLSSIAVYGHGKPPFNEDMKPDPCDPYGIAKYSVEMDLKAANEMWGLPYVIFRPHNVYGERQNLSDPYRNVIGLFMNNHMLGKPLNIFGDGTQTRAFSYIDDVAPVIAESIDVPECWNQTFNIGGSVPCSVNELAILICGIMGDSSHPIKYLPARNEVQHAYCDHYNVRKYFGTMIKGIPLLAGLKRMAEWAKTQEPKQGQKFSPLDITKKLPPSWSEIV